MHKRFLGYLIGAAFVLALPIIMWSLASERVTYDWRPASLLARHWGRQLDALPDREVAGQAERIAELESAGTAVLVAALGSSREIVVAAAGNALHGQLDRWAQLPPGGAEPRIVEMAHLLGKQFDTWDRSSQRVAADLAMRILAWPLAPQTPGNVQMLAHCQHILQAVEPTARVARVDGAATPASKQPVVPTPAARPEMEPDMADPVDIIALPDDDLPGGNLPVEEVPLPPLPPSLTDPPSPRPLYGEPPRLVPPSGRQQLPRVMFPDAPPAPEPQPVLPDSPIPRQLPEDARDDRQMNRLTGATMEMAPHGLEHLADLDLLERLRGATPTQQNEVENELRRRGFEQQELRMARLLASSDPRARRRLAESLPGLQTPPGPWLFWLSYDDDPMVRKLVVALMASSQNPRLHRRLREMRSLETDAMVRDQLERLPVQSAGR